jgi:hypothetical protein
MDGILDRSKETLAFIDELRSRGASEISFARLVIKFAEPPLVLDKPSKVEHIPEKQYSLEELDALLYAETTKL